MRIADSTGDYSTDRLVIGMSVSVNTAAVGGNADLLSIGQAGGRRVAGGEQSSVTC
ncbi:hypothetical protein AWB68_08122 [Caballeronia choica]|uniref:Uncharacterized protein n=1 Tax=Caballeronia choica TaxID=326476 RepID=A0A158L167_9BURK|nr:hypothetical protein AWB68_08122 [Caballeronia choica]